MVWNIGDFAKAVDTVRKIPSFVAIEYVGDDYCLLINTSTIQVVEFGVDLAEDRPYARIHFNYKNSETGKQETYKVADKQSIKNLRSLYR